MRLSLIGLAAAIAFSWSCEKESGPAPAPSPLPPDAVVATVSVPSLDAAIAGVNAYADAAGRQPQAAFNQAQLMSGLAQVAGAASLDGLDVAGPLHVVIADAPTRFAVLGKVTDGKRLEAGRGE